MLCVISLGNWNNGSNAGSRNRNLNNNRTNANNNVGFACDSMPYTPHAVCTVWQRGSLRRALRRNVLQQTPLVAVASRVAALAKIGFVALFQVAVFLAALLFVALMPSAVTEKCLHWMRMRMIAKAICP
jgi:hypothetical protein